jgi:hypothetical protein
VRKVNKVILTKEQAEALESAKSIQIEEGYDLSNIVAWKVNDLFSHDEEALNQLELDTLIKALYVGYEVEKSPEEKVRDYYHSIIETNTTPIMNIKIATIEKTLDLLGIKIKGVNCV